MAAAVDQDIDSFIRDQKSKLASERKAFQGGDDSRSAGDALRRQWDRNAGRDAQFAVEVSERPRTQEQGLPLTNRDSAKKRAALGTERRQEYNDYIKQKEAREGSHRRHRSLTPPDVVGLPVESHQKYREALDKQRQSEYQEYIRQKENKQPIGGDGVNAQKHDYKHTSMQLAQQRRQEYNDMLAAKEREPKAKMVDNEITNPTIIPFDRVEEDRIKKRLMEEERHREYQKVKAKLDEAHNRGRRQYDDSEHLGLDVGQYEKSKQKGKEQREYREILERQVADKKMFQQHGARQTEVDRGYREPRSVPLADVQPTREDVPRLKLAAITNPDPPQRKKKEERKILTPEGEPDVALDARARKELERQEYLKIWENVHGKDSRRTYHFPRSHDHRSPRSHDHRIDDSRHYRNNAANQFDQSPRPANQDDEHSPKRTADAGNAREKQKILEDLEYQEIWRKEHLHEKPPLQSQKKGNRSWREPSAEKLLPLGQNEYRRKELEAERNREYNAHLKAQNVGNRTWQEASGETLPLGDYESKRRAVEEERKREYQEYLRKHDTGGRRNLIHQTDEYKASFPGMNESDNTKLQKARERNDEYNKFLREKEDGRRVRYPDDQADNSGVYATLPLRDSHSAKQRQEQQRNREYNQFLASKMLPARDDGRPPVAPRKGWGTPTYEDMLDKKRQQEAQYRRRNDGGGYDYNPLEPPRRAAPRDDSSNYYATLPIGQRSSSAKQRKKDQYRDDLERQMREAADGKRRERQRERFGSNDTGEKQMDMKVSYSGFLDPEVDRKTVGNRPRQPHVEAYQEKLSGRLEKLDQISPRSEMLLRQRRGNRAGGAGILDAPISLTQAPPGGGGLLDNDFESLLGPPRVSSLAPPAALTYTPLTYLTGDGSLGLGQSSVDEAYKFYATRNPLDDGTAPDPGDRRGRGPNVVVGRPGASDQEVGSFGGGGGGGDRRSRVTFRDEGGRNAGLGDFPTDDDNKSEAKRKARSYQEELQRQIEEKKWKKIKEKEEKERYELKMEREAQDYNPFGRSGGGAPMRDPKGRIVADLRSMRQDNNNPNSPRKYTPHVSPRAPAGGDVRDDLFGPPPVQTTADGEESYARGGHGIFGMPKTEKEKNDAERYKDDLRRQIEQRKIEELRRKEAERLEEEKEMKKLEEQQRRMKAEYEAEQQKIKDKEDEARRKNEELIRQAEERKREAEERRKAAEEARAAEERKEKEAEFNARLAEARGSSPPVPAARTRTLPSDEQPSTSEQANPPPRAGSADVLNQLAAMRSQLQNERKRVETMLQNEKNEPDVFDPRLVQRPAPAPVVKPEVDIFETARTGNAVQVRRTPADRANPQAMDEFSQLKKGQSESRKEFQRLFPDQPSSGDTLEAQQAALLQYQEQRLQNLRDRREYDSGYPKSNTPARSLQTRTPQQLHSDSAFVDMNSVSNFPDDFDDIPPTSQWRNESARSRRRNRGDSSPPRRNWRDSSPRGPNRRDSTPRDLDPFGSTTSLNVDRLAKKNQDRLKRLREMQGDEVSLYDADDVLDRFMSKQAHNRNYIRELDSEEAFTTLRPNSSR